MSQPLRIIPTDDEDGTLHRFGRGEDLVDLLAPDNLGPRSSRTTVPPGETIEAAGTRRALGTARPMLVDAGDGAFTVRVPSLAGAIILKARVAGVVSEPTERAKHERDLARLLAIAHDAGSMTRTLTKRDRARLRERMAMIDTSHPAWHGVIGGEDGAIALRVLASDPPRT